ncbi:acyltransferase family protein, partial [Streptomyces coerulescens]
PSSSPVKPAPKKSGRDRYLDLLRTIALVRVVAFHTFGWAWLTVIFPSMGIMFALAGALMARSLKRPAWGVIRGRLRRLLPPLWVFAAAVVPLMFLLGWKPADDLGGDWFLELLNYIVPIGTPPFPLENGSPSGLLDVDWATTAAVPLWYIRAYLWFVIASPLLLWAFRRMPWATVLAPLAFTAVLSSGLVTMSGQVGEAVTDFAIYGSCWVLGFAHAEGKLKEISRWISLPASAAVMAFGLWWASGHQVEGWNLNEIPLAQAAWSLGFVVILLTFSPSWQQLPGKLAVFDKMVTLFNNRAVTIYLWHMSMLLVTSALLGRLWEIPGFDEHFGQTLETHYAWFMFVLVWPLVGLMIVSVGWVEDLAAKRSPRLWPTGSKRT